MKYIIIPISWTNRKEGNSKFDINECKVLETVIRGHQRLWAVMQEKDALYAKPDFNDDDGMRAAELEGDFADMSGWEAEAMAGSLLTKDTASPEVAFASRT